MSELVLSGANHADTRIFELRSTSTTKDLEDVQYSEVNKFTILSTVNLGTWAEVSTNFS